MLSRRLVLVLGVAGLAAACASTDPAPTFPAFSFKGQPILLNVGDIATQDNSSNLGEGHIEADFDVSPRQALNDWAADRLQAAGTAGQATYTITEASAVQQSLGTTSGIRGAFTTDQAWRITVRLAAEISAVDGSGLNTGRASAQVERSTTLPENVTLIERRQAYYTLMGDAIRDFDRQIQGSITQYMGAFRR